MIFSFGPECRVPERVTSFVAATDTRHAVVEHDGHQHGIELRLTPLGAHMLLGVPMDELTCRVVELDALLGREADELIERMHDAGGAGMGGLVRADGRLAAAPARGRAAAGSRR